MLNEGRIGIARQMIGLAQELSTRQFRIHMSGQLVGHFQGMQQSKLKERDL